MAKGGLAALAFVAALGAPAAAQEEGRPAADAPSRKVIHDRTPVAPHNALFATYKTPGIHDAARRCGGRVAAGGAGAAASHASDRISWAESPAAFASRVEAFRQGLGQTGHIEGQNVAVEFRWAEGQHTLPAICRTRRSPAQRIRRCGPNATFRTRLQRCDGDWWPLSPRHSHVAHAAPRNGHRNL
jgi:hypothetical protein